MKSCVLHFNFLSEALCDDIVLGLVGRRVMV